VIFVGVDWSETHHDVCAMDQEGRVVGRERVPEGLEGVARLHALLAEHVDEPEEVIIGIETDRGLLVRALVAAGYHVVAVNPMAAQRYRDRHVVSGAKSDPGDAKVLADLVRTDRANHREVAGDSELVEGLKALARSHQSMIWARQRQTNYLRSILREFYPGALTAFGGELAGPDALAVLAQAPTPAAGRGLSGSRIAGALRRGGRQRGLQERAAAIRAVLREPQLEAPPTVSEAYGTIVAATVGVITELSRRIADLEQALASRFEEHPDAGILRSLPGLGIVLGARVLGEFGDDRTRYAHARSRKNYAGTAPITKASGRSRVVLARKARNRRLADAMHMWAFCSLSSSPGARRHYDALRARGNSNRQALRAVANRWVGILHGCLTARAPYCEEVAWGPAAVGT
jgi:hypothetical protein